VCVYNVVSTWYVGSVTKWKNSLLERKVAERLAFRRAFQPYIHLEGSFISWWRKHQLCPNRGCLTSRPTESRFWRPYHRTGNIRVPLLCNPKEQRAPLSDLWCSCKTVTSDEGEKEDTLIMNATENRRHAASLFNTESLNNVRRHPNDTTRLTSHQ
jgi:hypothetical protein